MVPYQIYQALTQQRSHDLQVSARHHERMGTAQLAPAKRTEPWTRRVREAFTHLAKAGQVSTPAATSGPRVRSKATSTSAAGPMGCVA